MLAPHSVVMSVNVDVVVLAAICGNVLGETFVMWEILHAKQYPLISYYTVIDLATCAC